MDEVKIEEALEGKIKLEELNDEELTAFRSKARELAEKEKGEVSGLREAKRSENERVEKLRKEAEELEEARRKQEEDLNKGKQEVSQFRTEQIDKAKEIFYKQFPDAKEKEKEIAEKFEKLDSGKIDSEFILKDFISAYAATDPDGYTASRDKIKELEKNAAEHKENAAGSHGSAPVETDPKKYSDETTQLAKEAGISEESADKINKEGLSRKYE